MAITLEEWTARYKQRFFEVILLYTDCTDPMVAAQNCVDAAEFPDVMEGYEDDPEGAADMEISYWEE